MGGDYARAGVVSVPEEVADATFETDAREHVRCVQIIAERTHTRVSEHGLTELVEALPAGIPAGRYDKREIARIKLFSLLDELVVDGRGTRAEAAVVELVWGIA